MKPDPRPKQAPADVGSEKPRIKMQLYKTEPCQNWTMYGVCRYGNLCKFAHGMEEQRSRLRHPKYKTSLCKDFPLGKCTFGNRCNFAHSLEELRSSVPAASGTASPSQPSHQQQQHLLIQTPVRILPDGRMISSFTPVSSSANGGGPGGDADDQDDDGRGLRRYQSMGTLRAMPAALVPAVSNTAFGASGDTMSSAFAASSHPWSAQAQTPAQAALHLHHDQNSIARRVASLSQLPSLYSTGTPQSSLYLPGTAAYNPSSPLVHQSPVMSTPSPREFDASSGQILSDTTFAGGDWTYQQQHHLPAQALQQPVQRRTLTSSISMQTLPRFKAPVSWDNAHPFGMPAAGSATGSFGSQHLHTISSQSSATLIDSDVWSSSAYSPALEQTPPKLSESRFFPASADIQPATSGLRPCQPPSPYGSHHQLRRQQSTDDWVLLRNAHDRNVPKPFLDQSIPSAAAVARGLYR
ncbi:hypothetical protein GGF46_000204 [Coemansia sp. RSA 552]|nr:hypothetical protein GGF46_000204 [Coemansia sp. RSA 552]